ncbi:hypothetical protein ACP4OV_023562 [Aristida adscensionis]
MEGGTVWPAGGGSGCRGAGMRGTGQQIWLGGLACLTCEATVGWQPR